MAKPVIISLSGKDYSFDSVRIETGELKSWVMPVATALKHATKPEDKSEAKMTVGCLGVN